MSRHHPYNRNVWTLHYDHPAAPPAGLPVQVITPVASRLQIVSVFFSFTTDANVADRYVYVAPALGGADHIRFHACRPQAANLTWSYNGFMGQTEENGIAPLAQRVNIPLGVDCIFDNCDRFYITAENIQVGDQFTLIYYYYNTWFTGVVIP
jgi:hypothetical protein